MKNDERRMNGMKRVGYGRCWRWQNDGTMDDQYDRPNTKGK